MKKKKKMSGHSKVDQNCKEKYKNNRTPKTKKKKERP